MDVRITSVASSDVGQKISDVTVPLEESLRDKVKKELSEMEGIGQFMVVVVAVDSDPAINEGFCKGYHKVGSYTHPITGKRTKFIGFALNLDPQDVSCYPHDALKKAICTEIIKHLNNNDLKIPKKFDYQKFSSYLKEVLVNESL